MGFSRPVLSDGQLQRIGRAGDIVVKGVMGVAYSAADANASWSVANMLGGLLIRAAGPTAGRTDTSPTAALILAALPEMDIGDSFMVMITNRSTQTITLAGGVGVTAAGNLLVLTLTSRWLLFTKLTATTMQMDAC